MSRELISQYRNFLKDDVRHQIDFDHTDQAEGNTPPPIQKPIQSGQKMIELPVKDSWGLTGSIDLYTAIENRKSRRRFSTEHLQLNELSFLLWATQGIRYMSSPSRAYRTVPSAGCRHAFESYLAIQNVESLPVGIYRYLPVQHCLVFEHPVENFYETIVSAASNQSFVGQAAAVFIWTVIPERMEWRYDIAAHKVIAIDAGHLCQNLYLACEAIKCGTCAVAAYEQQEMDRLVNVDGVDEFTIYLAPVGKV